MAIDVSHVDPAFVTVFSNTITTNTTYDANRPNDRSYVFADDIVGMVNPGVLVSGFGMFLSTIVAGGSIAMTNNGSVVVDQAAFNALHLNGGGGAVTYAGSGSITNYGGRALAILSSAGGSVDATISNDLSANGGEAVQILATNSPVAFTQAAGTILSNTPANGFNVVTISTTGSRDIVANLHGTIFGAQDSIEADNASGDVTVNFTGSMFSNIEDGIDSDTAGSITVNSSGDFDVAANAFHVTGNGAERVTVNVTGGQIHANNHGILATANDTGGILIDMTGGQIGTAAQRVGNTGISAQVTGTAGDLTIAATDIFASDNGIVAAVTNAAATGNIDLTINGTVDGNSGDGVRVDNNGTGNTTITNSFTGTIISHGAVGIRLNIPGGAGINTIVNNGTIMGNLVFGVGVQGSMADDVVINAGFIQGGVAVALRAGNDIYDGRGGTVVGTVLGMDGDDALFSGAGNETFDGGANVDTVDYSGAIGPVTVSLLAGTATGHGNDTLLNIENANGGSFGDTLIGGLGPNTFNGRGGDDTFVVVPGGGADTVVGFTPGASNLEDRVDVRGFVNISSLDDVLVLAAQVGPHTVVDFGDGDTLTLTNVAMTDLVDSDFTFVPRLGDVLWRHDDGRVRTADHDLGSVSVNFAVAGTGDFDGDGDNDILWRHTDGLTVIWELQGGALETVHNLGVVSTGFQVAETGDFDGDGDDDIVWRGDAGQVVTWEMQDGELVTNHNQPAVSTSFDIAGTGDFDDDGDADILWRGDAGEVVIWEMQGDAFVTNHNLPAVPAAWEIAGTGDFDGDGDADLVWRNDDAVVVWEIENNAFVTNHNQPDVPHTWDIESTRDFDGDGDADILWRHEEGQVVVWDVEDGNYVVNRNFGSAANTWQIAGAGVFDLG